MKDEHATLSLLKFMAGRDIPGVLVYAPTLTGSRIAREAFGSLKTLSPMADAISAYGNEHVVVLGPGIGAPACVLASEPYLAAGVKRFILFGTCGAFAFNNNSPQIGEVFIPDAAHSDDLTSALYGSEKHFPILSGPLANALTKEFKSEALPFRRGAVWTTDAPFKESPSKVDEMHQKGVIGVEMECAALAQLALKYKVEFVACLVVSDLLSDTWVPGFSKPALKTALLKVSAALVRVCNEETAKCEARENRESSGENFL